MDACVAKRKLIILNGNLCRKKLISRKDDETGWNGGHIVDGNMEALKWKVCEVKKTNDGGGELQT